MLKMGEKSGLVRGQHQSQDSILGGVSMSKQRFRIRRSANIKVKIQDEDCQG